MAATLSGSPILAAKPQDFTHDLDFSREQLRTALDLARKVKRTPSRYAKTLAGRYLSLLFEKPSLRTRMTFELAIQQLGGGSVTQTGPIGDREPIKDIARNLERWTQAIVARTFHQQTIDELARWSSVPVVNALSDMYHPCQALADMQTIEEKLGSYEGHKLAFVGDGNNVAHSLMLCCARLGMDFALAAPKGYEANPTVIAQAGELAKATGANLTFTNDPGEAVSGAHAIYTDVWASMGQESEADHRREVFGPYQVNEKLMADAEPGALFMHCLPAKRGQETTDAVMESAGSVVFDQAENRLHAQKALLVLLLS